MWRFRVLQLFETRNISRRYDIGLPFYNDTLPGTRVCFRPRIDWREKENSDDP